jgi:hypothetical protein
MNRSGQYKVGPKSVLGLAYEGSVGPCSPPFLQQLIDAAPEYRFFAARHVFVPSLL